VQLNFDDFEKTIVVPFSTIDWRGKAAMVIFLRGCNFKCHYCQNYRILASVSPADIKELLLEIQRNKDFVNALIFSGGEPTLHPTVLKVLATEAKAHGLLVGIETNGSFPAVLEALISLRLLNALFIDLKAPLTNLEKYTQITRTDTVSLHTERIRRAIDIGRIAFSTHALLEFELRTTLFKDLLSQAQINEMVNEFKDVPYALQQGRTELSLQKDLITMTRDEIVDIAIRCERPLKIRTHEKGEEYIP